MPDREEQLRALEEMQYLLERMLELARRSASDGCTDAQRVRLQQGLELLRGFLTARRTAMRGETEKMDKKGTVYFFTGLAGAGKTTIGGLFYRRMKARHNDVVLLDGDQLRRLSFNKQSRYTTEERREGAFYNFEMCKMLADQGINVVLCSISMYNDCRAWAREHIENYVEIYVKATMETLHKRDQKGLYSSKVKNVVGVDILCEEPEHPDFLVENDGQETPEQIVERLERQLEGKDGST